MNVIGVDPKDIPVSNFFPTIVPPDRLDEVLPRADVVFIAAPLTPESERMIGAKQFDSMKRGAYFIAVSRGRLYDKGALVKALDSQKLAGAGLDVTDPEPLPKGDALWDSATSSSPRTSPRKRKRRTTAGSPSSPATSAASPAASR